MSQSALFYLLAGVVLISYVSGQLVRQCSCPEVQPCKASHITSIVPCVDHCKKHAEAIGANYGRLRQCIAPREPQIKAAIRCFESRHGNSCGSSGRQIPKRYPETLKIAAMTEINHIFDRSGLTNEVQQFIPVGKKLFNCVIKCMDKRTDSCEKKLKCGLDLPSDNILIQDVKQCAMSAGLNNAAVREICQCAVNAGISRLAHICPRISVN